MRIIIVKIIPIILLFQYMNSLAQSKTLKNANKRFQEYEYAEAIRAYEKVLDKGYDSAEVYQKLGDSYYFNSFLGHAAKWYEELLNTSNEIPSIYYFRAAHAFKYLGEYEKAHKLMNRLVKVNENDPYAKRFANDLQYLDKITRQSGRYIIKNLSINSKNSDFAPSFYKNRLVFSSSREQSSTSDEKSAWTDQPYFGIYQGVIKSTGEVTLPSKFSRNLDFKFHESTTAFTKYGTTVYFTGTNIVKASLRKDPLQVNGLKMYRAYLGYEQQWIDSEELPFNSDQYSVAHPALSPDNQKLYFVSDMPGGYGLSDIYSVDILEDGSFGKPVNMGPEINTEGRDTFPFVSKTGMLYFSSNGHLGLGGLDVFVTDLKEEKMQVYNLGEPINSRADDMTFIIDDYTKKGYFSSNRKGGKGSDDIYSLEELRPLITECFSAIVVEVTEELSGSKLENVDITIKAKNGDIIHTGKTDKNGAFQLKKVCVGDSLKIIANKFFFTSITKKILIKEDDDPIVEKLSLRNVTPPSKGTDIGILLAINPIYFESSKSSITRKAAIELDKIVDYLKKNSSIKVEIRSHTDSRGKDSYNLWLSNERAKSTANYLITKGIDITRVKSKGYGEKELKNECKNGVECSADRHLENRRSEFVVVEGS